MAFTSEITFTATQAQIDLSAGILHVFCEVKAGTESLKSMPVQVSLTPAELTSLQSAVARAVAAGESRLKSTAEKVAVVAPK